MTEYDYSPDAIERHLAKQQQIANWVDQTDEHSPSNPFIPLPGEHTTQNPQPAFYATPQGVISPTYSSSRKHGHGHGHSQYHSPSSRGTPLIIPQGYKLPVRSFSPPPMPVRHFYSLPTTPYNTYPTGSAFNNSSSPHGSPPYQSPPISHPSYSQTSFHSAPHHQQPGGNAYYQPSYSQSSFHSLPSYANPVIQQQYTGNAYFQPSPPQPVQVVVTGGRSGSCVVVPAPGQHVQVIGPQPIYETQSRGKNFFGKLKKGFGTTTTKSSKSKKGTNRRDSY